MKQSTKRSVDLIHIRESIILAMFSDDFLVSKFVLKGGNALNIVHHLPGRTSVDVDLSIDGDFNPEELNDVERRIFEALSAQFGGIGFSVFDRKFAAKPKVPHPKQDPAWGGYMVEFKLIETEKFRELAGQEEARRRASLEIEPGGGRKFTVDISKHEYCEPKIAYQLNDSVIYVYTLPMLATEKLRAICQQLPEYGLRGYPTARARDFYDIFRIVDYRGVDLCRPENIALFPPIFAAKKVPVSLLALVSRERESHRADWDSVVNAATDVELRDYDYYFDFVVQLIEKLHAEGVK
jgi:predicted nucleotidyltransferase component of viral defense system